METQSKPFILLCSGCFCTPGLPASPPPARPLALRPPRWVEMLPRGPHNGGLVPGLGVGTSVYGMFSVPASLQPPIRVFKPLVLDATCPPRNPAEDTIRFSSKMTYLVIFSGTSGIHLRPSDLQNPHRKILLEKHRPLPGLSGPTLASESILFHPFVATCLASSTYKCFLLGHQQPPFRPNSVLLVTGH